MCEIKSHIFFLQVSASSASPLVSPMLQTFFTSTPWASCSWVLTYHPANKPWPSGTLGDVCTFGLMLQKFPLTTTRGRQILPCLALWTRCLSWTGITTCCLSHLSPCRWPAPSSCCQTGPLPWLHPAPGKTVFYLEGHVHYLLIPIPYWWKVG